MQILADLGPRVLGPLLDLSLTQKRKTPLSTRLKGVERVQAVRGRRKRRSVGAFFDPSPKGSIGVNLSVVGGLNRSSVQLEGELSDLGFGDIYIVLQNEEAHAFCAWRRCQGALVRVKGHVAWQQSGWVDEHLGWYILFAFFGG